MKVREIGLKVREIGKAIGLKVRDIGRAIGDFELNNIPKLIVNLILMIITLAVWGIYLIAKLIVKHWYVYFGGLLFFYFAIGGVEVSYYARDYFHVMEGINFKISALIMLVVGTAIYFIIKKIVSKTAHFFE